MGTWITEGSKVGVEEVSLRARKALGCRFTVEVVVGAFVRDNVGDIEGVDAKNVGVDVCVEGAAVEGWIVRLLDEDGRVVGMLKGRISVGC